jgi:SpoVK/Ycf46/Vps4 family AAA+-type ATPase
VLFDEIDELVRERDGGGVDAFGRFLTTSMLPKLAQLWEKRKLIYFVATNHIRYFDRAITRSGRFDNNLFVSPPSFSSKSKELTSLLRTQRKSVSFKVSRSDIEASIRSLESEIRSSTTLEDLLAEEIPTHSLAKFTLLRWDEIKSVANAIESDSGFKTSIDRPILERALRRVRRNYRDVEEYCHDQKFEGPVGMQYAPRTFN